MLPAQGSTTDLAPFGSRSQLFCKFYVIMLQDMGDSKKNSFDPWRGAIVRGANGPAVPIRRRRAAACADVGASPFHASLVFVSRREEQNAMDFENVKNKTRIFCGGPSAPRRGLS